MKKILTCIRANTLLSTIVAATAMISVACTPKEQINVIPYPQNVVRHSGSLTIPQPLTITYNGDEQGLRDLQSYLPDYPLKAVLSDNGVVNISFDTQQFDHNESYTMRISRKGININASDNAGAFYALQTLAQLTEGKSQAGCMTIDDSPRMAWRGMHLDCSRHFFDKQFVMKQLDALASIKVNHFHWHLTDGAGWRLQIPDYPLLTSVAAWREGNTWKEWWQADRLYLSEQDTTAYGGYYTADDVKEVLEYARLRHITIVPEIEMPGHSEEVTAVYPELACSGKPYTNGELCIGNEQTFEFFENVLDYVIDLFPSEYIHIGGDEASHEAWHNCPKCQSKIEELDLGDEYGLQGYLTERIERHINSRGRKMIGWDEVADCNITPSTTIMAWRSIENGIKAAQAGHDVVMTPGSNCYLDHYQADPSTQPEAIGGFNDLRTVYMFNPVADTLDSQTAQRIIGVQGNLWTEYIPTEQQAEYMLYPRMAALAECGWSNAQQKNWEKFKYRANRFVEMLQKRGYNPYPLSVKPSATQTVNQKRHCIELSLTSELSPVDIRYTTNGTEPTATSQNYRAPIRVTDSLLLRARQFKGKQAVGEELRMSTYYHKAIGKKVVYTDRMSYYTYDERYKGGGDSGLVDGLRGGFSYADGRWQGFCPRDMELTIDLEKVQPIRSVMANFMQVIGPCIYFPSKVEVWLSQDGTNFTLAGSQQCDVPVDRDGALFKDFGWQGEPQEARYVRYHAFQSSKRAFLFVDEVVVR